MTDIATRDERIADFARRQPGAATDRRTIAECEFCGWLEWICSERAEQPSVLVTRMELGRCLRCNTVRIRNPEVFDWVLSVLRQHEQGGGHTAQPEGRA